MSKKIIVEGLREFGGNLCDLGINIMYGKGKQPLNVVRQVVTSPIGIPLVAIGSCLTGLSDVLNGESPF